MRPERPDLRRMSAAPTISLGDGPGVLCGNGVWGVRPIRRHRARRPRRSRGLWAALTAPRIFTIVGGGCSNQAFVEIVQTAKAHNVSTLSLADALVALAQNQASQDGDDAVFVAARAAWGHLVCQSRAGRGVRFDDENDAVPGA